MNRRIHTVYFTDGERRTYDRIRFTDSGWLSCRIDTADLREAYPPHRIERVESYSADESAAMERFYK